MPIRIQTEDFDIGKEIERLRSDNHEVGAVVSFTGTVRETAKGEPISSMTLEHYPGMTEKELTRISDQAHERWPLIDSLIIHRIGELKPGENIVLVITLSSHRHAAFEAASFLMDYLKSKAPFWKKEQPVSGDAHWVDARESDKTAIKRWQQK